MNQELPPHMQLAIMSREYVVSRAIHAIAQLGIADHMSDSPTSIEKLAESTSTIPDLLERVLSFLADYGLFIKTQEGYALTPLSYPLQQNHPCSMKHVFGMVDEAWWQAFSHLEMGLKTGIPPYIHQHNEDFFSTLNNNPQSKNRFNHGMDKLSAIDDQAIAEAYPFTHLKSLIDIGYGRENLSVMLQEKNPSLFASCFKLEPAEIHNAQSTLFSSVGKADAYLFKGILHDFNDDSVKHILTCLYQKIPDQSTLLIAEQVIPDTNLPHTNKTMDIIMMVLVGGKQRTLSNWIELATSAGFQFKKSYPTKGLFTIIELSSKSIGIKNSV